MMALKPLGGYNIMDLLQLKYFQVVARLENQERWANQLVNGYVLHNMIGINQDFIKGEHSCKKQTMTYEKNDLTLCFERMYCWPTKSNQK
jgi:hypothetical protein